MLSPARGLRCFLLHADESSRKSIFNARIGIEFLKSLAGFDQQFDDGSDVS